MNHTDKLKELNAQLLENFEAYINFTRPEKEHHDKIEDAKKEWQDAWNKFMETLLVLERLEI